MDRDYSLLYITLNTVQRGTPKPSNHKVWTKAEIFLAKEPYTAPIIGAFRKDDGIKFPRSVFKVKLAPISTFDDLS